ncbi:OmpA family protein [Flavobacterium psychrotolerans]|uniref:Flagellar motor protein MotB n=1 Tax=Flavobacterium psychrotolerans TaxID=2169410 RepID=A0A2U1JGQ6_9FLAO|nr:OmpA family protein [Flavobacterium psychrotolerans]PWA04205.1 flagellar motor protein MotB [Flavobacterium psychrotolerans]
MKKSLILLSFTLLTISNGIAQSKDNEDSNEGSTFNKWTVELNAGNSKGLKPYTTGYFASNTDSYFGSFALDSYGIGVRYMISPKFGFKLDLSSDLLENNKDTDSRIFKVQQYRIGVQGVINAARFLDMQKELGRFGLLFHGGIQIAQMTPKLAIDDDGKANPAYNHTEDNGGIIFGISPEFRVTKKISLMTDISFASNLRQNFNWDGHWDKEPTNLTGSMVTTTFGITYSLGKGEIHGDWADIDDKKSANFKALDDKVSELENMLNDTDKDGVPDYLDAENNSITGIAVDTKGRMVDTNKNGVPDELEKFMDKTYVGKSKDPKTSDTAIAEVIKKLINEGYATVYFDSNKSNLTNISTEGVDFILNFLRSNPTTSVDITGHADEIGNTKSNQKLALTRATNVKNTLIKAGINPYRLNVKSEGEDTSVDPKSKDARSLVRRVTFKIKN